MKIQRQFLAIAALAAITATICFHRVVGAHQSVLHVNTVIFARNGEAKDAVTTFSPKDHEIYCIADVVNQKADAAYKFNWSRYDENEQQHLIYQQELTNQTTSQVVSKFSSQSDLPTGHYKVDLWVSGHHKQSRFDVTN